MDKRKANGLQDNDVGFPNTPVRRYMHRKKLEKEMFGDDAPSQQLEQPTIPSQQQHMQVQQPYIPGQQPHMQLQQSHAHVQQPQTQMQQQHMQMQQPHMQMLQPHMQMQQPHPQMHQQQPFMQGQRNILTHQKHQQQQNMPPHQNQTDLNQPQEIVAFQDSEKCTKRREALENGMDLILSQQKKHIRQFDPEASIMKQRIHENQWPFENNQQMSHPDATQQSEQSYSEKHDICKTTQHPQGFYKSQMQPQQMMFEDEFSHPNVYHHAQHLKSTTKPMQSLPAKNGMQPTRSTKLSEAYNQNYHGHNHQLLENSLREQGEISEVNENASGNLAGDYENNPHLMGQNPGHVYQPMYAGFNQRNHFQQPSYYMNQPTGGQHYQQSFQGQAQMQT